MRNMLGASLALAAIMGLGDTSPVRSVAENRPITNPNFRFRGKHRHPISKRRDWKFERRVVATNATTHPRHIHPRHKRPPVTDAALSAWEAAAS